MGLKKETKTAYINCRVTEDTKQNLEQLIELIEKETGYSVSQSDVITRLINRELDRKLGFYSEQEG